MRRAPQGWLAPPGTGGKDRSGTKGRDSEGMEALGEEIGQGANQGAAGVGSSTDVPLPAPRGSTGATRHQMATYSTTTRREYQETQAKRCIANPASSGRRSLTPWELARRLSTLLGGRSARPSVAGPTPGALEGAAGEMQEGGDSQGADVGGIAGQHHRVHLRSLGCLHPQGDVGGGPGLGGIHHLEGE